MSAIRLVTTAALVGCLALINSPSSWAVPWSDPSGQFTVELPEQAVRLDTGRIDAPLAVRFGAAGVPNLNVVVTPGAYELLGRAPKLQGQRVLESYQLLGLTSSKLISSAERSTSCGPAFEALIEYEMNGTTLRAWVRIVSGSDRQFTLSYLDQAESAGSTQLREQIFDSFCPTRAQPPAAGEQPATNTWWFLLLIFGGAGLAALVWRTLRVKG